MEERSLPHLIVSDFVEATDFVPVTSGPGGNTVSFDRDKIGHGQRLRKQIEFACSENANNSVDAPLNVVALDGTYITFSSFPDSELVFKSLEKQGKGENPKLVSLKNDKTDSGVTVQLATVWIPDGGLNYFLNKLDKFIETAEREKPKNFSFITSIESIKRATLESLWVDEPSKFPSNLHTEIWWEVWLRQENQSKTAVQFLVDSLREIVAELDVHMFNQGLSIGDRTVVLLKASADQLLRVFQNIDTIAELRAANLVGALPVLMLPRSEQMEWVCDLKSRVRLPSENSPAVCILDTGVQSTHPLLNDFLADSDKHVADPVWNHDPVKHPHGTEMAGLALYCDFDAAVISTDKVDVLHRLESVKILPDKGNNEPLLYGAITARAVDQPEITHPNRPRVFMMAITAHDSASISAAGSPTSWSAAVDALAFGCSISDSNDSGLVYLDREEELHPRLFVLSAGNIRQLEPMHSNEDYRVRNDTEAIEDPAQCWNAITVGAYSAKDDMSDCGAEFMGWTPVAQRGDISPASRTSVVFDSKKWMSKPDVVADGGNYAKSPECTEIDSPDGLAILTTGFRRAERYAVGVDGLFGSTRDTSAATARVASIAAGILAKHPHLRPETVRALIVHSAEWTNVMYSQFRAKELKAGRKELLRRYGMGVPDLNRALLSAKNAVTLVVESQIKPYGVKDGKKDVVLKEANEHALPWPIECLEELGETKVKMRVTLSYFVEPNPSSRGWSGRYTYASHGLRFAVKRPEDDLKGFRMRHNKSARIEGEKLLELKPEKGWFFGAKHHESPGSLHTDIWEGTAAQLAAKGAVIVYPVGGWWKEQPKFNQSDRGVHYSLVISIEAPETDVDLYTPILNKINVAAETEVEI